VKQNKTGFQTLATVFMSRPRRRFGTSFKSSLIASMENSQDTFEESVLNVSFDELSIEG
jgi:hypothetical protein